MGRNAKQQKASQDRTCSRAQVDSNDPEQFPPLPSCSEETRSKNGSAQRSGKQSFQSPHAKGFQQVRNSPCSMQQARIPVGAGKISSGQHSFGTRKANPIGASGHQNCKDRQSTRTWTGANEKRNEDCAVQRKATPSSARSESASLISSRVKKPRVIPHMEGCQITWKYRDTNGWKAFDRRVSDKVEHAYYNQETMIAFEAFGHDYHLDFDSLRQWRVASPDKTRRVQRQYEPPFYLKLIVEVACSSFKIQKSKGQPLQALCGNNLESLLLNLADCYTGMLRKTLPEKQTQAALPLPAWRGCNIDAHIVIAAASIAHSRVFPWLGECVLLCHTAEQELHEELQNILKHEVTFGGADNGLPLRLHEGTHQWIKACNAPQSRLERIAGACSSLQEHRQYVRDDKDFAKTHRWEKTDRLACHDRPNVCHMTGMTLVDAALHFDPGMNRIAIVNAASAYHVGGGFLTGGRHALEEALCMQSTLYISLARAFGRNASPNGAKKPYIPEDGCIESPNVMFTRNGTLTGYERMGQFKVSAVLSVAMPNKNAAVKDSPVDKLEGKPYMVLLQKKFATVVRCALEADCNILVIPDCGCGVFKNSPSKVGEALGTVLSKLGGNFQHIVLVGSKDFADAVMSAVGSPTFQPSLSQCCINSYPDAKSNTNLINPYKPMKSHSNSNGSPKQGFEEFLAVDLSGSLWISMQPWLEHINSRRSQKKWAALLEQSMNEFAVGLKNKFHSIVTLDQERAQTIVVLDMKEYRHQSPLDDVPRKCIETLVELRSHFPKVFLVAPDQAQIMLRRTINRIDTKQQYDVLSPESAAFFRMSSSYLRDQ